MFEYRVGDLYTNKRWDRPNKTYLQNWYKEVSRLPGFEDYQYWVGQSLFNVTTWDVDIVMVGEIEDYNILKNILTTSKSLGFEHLQLIDIFHSDQLWDFSKPFKPFTKIRSWDYYIKTVNGIVELECKIENSEEIIPGLFKKVYNEPPSGWNWGKQKFEEGAYNNKHKLLSDILA